VRDAKNSKARGISGRPDYVRQACEGSLRRLAWMSLSYYQHRVDPETPIEDTVGALCFKLCAKERCVISGYQEAGWNDRRAPPSIDHGRSI